MTDWPQAPAEADEPPRGGLWKGDTGRLSENARRALLKLVRGPYLSGETNTNLWSALLADEDEIRSRLNDLFLDLIVDPVLGFAFVRNVSTEELATPSAVRTETLTFLDTAMLLVLRQILLSAEGERRVIVGRDEVFDRLRVYRTPDRDEADFAKRLNASWLKMRNTLRIVHATERAGGVEDRVEISPVLALIVDADQVTALRAEYDRIAASGGSATPVSDADNDAENAEAAENATDVEDIDNAEDIENTDNAENAEAAE